MISYVIVGSGYRAEYYGRIACKFPNLFRALFLCRSDEKARLVEERTGIAGTADPERAAAFRPDFVVAAVSRENVGAVTIEWAEKSFPVLAETPVASTPEELEKLWTLHQKTGIKISSSEQYHRYPILASGLSYLKNGLIGAPVSAYLSLAHEYHGFSLIRRGLQTENETYSVYATRTDNDAAATDSRYGAILDGSWVREERDTAFITFASGKTAIYDFASLQYRSFIRSRHLSIRGEKGEWSDRIIYYADSMSRPQRVFLMPEIDRRYQHLDTQALRDLRKVWVPELFLDTEQDEFAIASVLLDMGQYVNGGSSPYPLREALDDAYFTMLLAQAKENPWQRVDAEFMPWMEGMYRGKNE